MAPVDTKMHTTEREIVRPLFDRYFRDDIKQSDDVSSHWDQLHRDINVALDSQGIQNLKGYGFGDLQNRSLIYRFFSMLTILCYLLILPNRLRLIRLLPDAMRLSRRMGLFFTYDAFRQVCAFACLEPFLKKASASATVFNIGDGYGFFSSLIKDQYPQTKIIMVDLGKTLLFQAHFCFKAHPQSRHRLLTGRTGSPGREQPKQMDDVDFIYCPSDELHLLEGHKFHLVTNIASMQEMNEATIKKYFSFLRRNLYPGGIFYCCNRVEKVMPGGEIARFADYPWSSEDRHLIDERCPWYRFFLSLHKAARGPKLGPVRIPFVNYFDGPIQHRLSQLQLNR